jgi:hypothetical protein
MNAGASFCAATATLPWRNILEINGVAGKTLPAPSGAEAVQFPQFSLTTGTLKTSTVSPLPKSAAKNIH